MENKILGALGEGADSRDFIRKIIGGENIKSAKCFSNIKYNQNLTDRYSCTGIASCGMISDVTGYALPLSFRDKVWENQLATGAIEGRGDYVQNGVKQAVKLFNKEYPELPYYLEYIRIEDIMNTKELASILKSSSVVTGYTSSMYSDAQDNGKIDNNDNRDGGGHCIRIVKRWIRNGIEYIKYCDNYEGVNKYNVIEVKDFIRNLDFFSGGYYLEKVYK